MGFAESAIAIIVAIAGGAAGAALINAMHDRWRFRADRKAVKEDRAEEKANEIKELKNTLEEIQSQLKDMKDTDAAQSEALKLVLLDRILYLGKSHIAKGEISYDDRRRFHAMHQCYHTGLGGNGDADPIVSDVDELPLSR